MKKFCIMLLCVAVSLCFAACNHDPQPTGTTTSPSDFSFSETPSEPSSVATVPTSSPTYPSNSVHIHDWTDATCTEPETCTICGVTKGDAKGHLYVAASVADPTCTEEGYTNFVCADCRDTYVGDYTAALGHNWSDATCIEAKFCDVCGITEGTVLEHSYSAVITEPTCVDQGFTTYTCTHCGYSYTGDYTDPLQYEDGTLVFCANGVAYMFGDNSEVIATYSGVYDIADITSGWLTETYTYTTENDGAPWYEYKDSIRTVIIEDGVSPVSTQVWFYNFDNLVSVTIGNSVESIAPYTFRFCDNLQTIVFGKESQLSTIEKEAFSYCKSLTGVIIPSGVKTIGDSAFNHCASLTSIEIPAAVTSIGRGAFGSTGLTSIEIPARVQTIGASAFMYCSNLSCVTFSENSKLTSISNYLFGYCDSLVSISIPNGVTSIGQYAFAGCTKLASATISNNVSTIDYAAFQDCSSLVNIALPSSVTRILDYAFDGCSNLESIAFAGTVTQWNAIYKSRTWNNNLPAMEVVCSDGTVSLKD